MDKQFVTTSASPHVLLDIKGELRLKGQDEPEVIARSDDQEGLSLEAHDDQVVINCTGSCSVRVPRAATVQVQAVHSSATIKALEGDLVIENVYSDLVLRNVANVKVEHVYGNLTAKNVDGNLEAGSINGEVSVKNIQGEFMVSGSVLGNLNLSDVGGSAKAETNGNISLHLDPAPGHTFEFYSHGNLFCRVSEDASVEISVPKASQVMTNLPGIHASAPVQTPYALTLGEGDAKLTLSADGNVILDTHTHSWEMEDFDIDVGKEVEGMADTISEQIDQQVESQMRMMEEQLNAQLSSLSMRLSAAKLSEEQARLIEERARLSSERAATRAQEKMHRAQEKIQQKMMAMQRKMEMKSRERERASRHATHHLNFNIPTPPVSPTPSGEPVSEDERMMILQMLEEKKITLEEAESLLSALEDKE